MTLNFQAVIKKIPENITLAYFLLKCKTTYWEDLEWSPLFWNYVKALKCYFEEKI